jgi:hypothetical protein
MFSSSSLPAVLLRRAMAFILPYPCPGSVQAGAVMSPTPGRSV